MFLQQTVADSLCWKEWKNGSELHMRSGGCYKEETKKGGVVSSGLPWFPLNSFIFFQASRGFQFHTERLGAVTQIKPLSWTHRTKEQGYAHRRAPAPFLLYQPEDAEHGVWVWGSTEGVSALIKRMWGSHISGSFSRSPFDSQINSSFLTTASAGFWSAPSWWRGLLFSRAHLRAADAVS